jgi:hypothetical protein
MKANQPNKESIMNEKILKIATCPSLSGRSTLTYHVGCKEDQSIHLRIYQNSGTGIHSKDWVALAQLDESMQSEDKPITASMLKELFKGKSTNTTGFILAALIHEGLIRIDDESKRTYQRIDPVEFKKTIQALIDAGTNLMIDAPATQDKEKPSKAKKDTTPKKPKKSSEGE